MNIFNSPTSLASMAVARAASTFSFDSALATNSSKWATSSDFNPAFFASSMAAFNLLVSPALWAAFSSSLAFCLGASFSSTFLALSISSPVRPISSPFLMAASNSWTSLLPVAARNSSMTRNFAIKECRCVLASATSSSEAPALCAAWIAASISPGVIAVSITCFNLPSSRVFKSTSSFGVSSTATAAVSSRAKASIIAIEPAPLDAVPAFFFAFLSAFLSALSLLAAFSALSAFSGLSPLSAFGFFDPVAPFSGTSSSSSSSAFSVHSVLTLFLSDFDFFLVFAFFSTVPVSVPPSPTSSVTDFFLVAFFLAGAETSPRISVRSEAVMEAVPSPLCSGGSSGSSSSSSPCSLLQPMAPSARKSCATSSCPKLMA
mmetsp:Transcript_110417/g.319101  ORF Transcript_110417/g.319101 Transcript_110417/m.319101 type:complete len:375 (-) Transcript_110417:1337-2461(-)